MDSGDSTGSSSTGTPGEESSTTAVNPTVASSSSSSSSSSTSTGVEPPRTCARALDASSCAEASDPDFEVCGWQPAYTFDLLSCQRISTDTGHCVVEQGLDGCSEPLETCEDGSSWYYRVIDDTVEVIDATGSCYGLGDFEPCPFGGISGSTTSDSGGTTSADTGGIPSTSVGGGATGTGGLETGFGESTGSWSLGDEIAAVCACACDT